MSKQTEVFVAPRCPTCGHIAEPNFAEVSSFGDPTRRYILEWRCYAQHKGQLITAVNQNNEGDI